MVRPASVLVVVALMVAGCAAARTGGVPQAPREPEFANEQAKMLACLDLRDHIVDLYASEYVEREGLAMSPVERSVFRDGWAEELAKRGTFDRFDESCFTSLTPAKYTCGMASRTTGRLVACMKLGAADMPRSRSW